MPREEELESDDAALLAATAAGDRAALGLLAARHQASIHRFALRMTRDAALAEDVLQETFIAALKHADGYRGSGSVRGWLLSIARNNALMLRRRRAGEPAAFEPLEELGVAAGWGDDTPERALEAHERRRVLEQGLATLSDGDREVLLLRDVEGLSGEETAAALGLTLAGMKSRLHRARLKLAAAVRGGGDDGRGS
ncbi:sigma-70 family RNA polymerase sigma factor [Myxococcota bacterium]|nr:sigma-70 family RNA polymerase sigma factor [Myxococcota bacterium]